MAFKMKAGAGGPMKKNFPSAFKADIPEVTVEAKEDRVAVLKPGYIYKDNKFYEEGDDPSYSPTEVDAKDAVEGKRKSRVKTGGRTLEAMTGGVKSSLLDDDIDDVVVGTKRKTGDEESPKKNYMKGYAKPGSKKRKKK